MDLARVVDMLADTSIDVAALVHRYDVERRLRLEPARPVHGVEAEGKFSHYVEDPYSSAPGPRAPVTDDVDVLVVGAGHSGLLAGVRLRQAGIEDVRLVDIAGDVGGVWYWNRYPGIQCDVESYIYMPLLEETGYVPTRRYAPGQEIFEHAQRIARSFDLYAKSLLQTRVTSVVWSEEDQRWIVGTDRSDRVRARYVVMANGNLSKPKLPAVPGVDRFRGHTFHTSRWDYDYTGGTPENPVLDKLGDKRVGVVGTGATAIQVVPALGPAAEQLYVFQRTPSVVGIRGNRDTDPEWYAKQPKGWQRDRMINFTAVTGGEEPYVDLVGDGWTEIQKNISRTAAVRKSEELGRPLSEGELMAAILASDLNTAEKLRERVAAIVTDPGTAESLKAWYYLYCKRPTFHDEYLPTFNRPNVELVDTRGAGLEAFTESGVVVGGQEYELDCLVFASGFDVVASHRRVAGYDPVGRGGLRLSEKWALGPRTLWGVQTRDFPNMFFTGMIQNGSVLNYTHLLDEQARHIAHVVSRATADGLVVVEPTAEAESAWLAEMGRFVTDAEVSRWQRCTPGIFNAEGDPRRSDGFLWRRYGGGAMAYFAFLEAWREEGRLAGLDSARASELAGSGPEA
jgi:cation diffusion facilitator CzcD-associated flavoprotein CzcO